VQHKKIGKKKYYAMWYLALRLDKQVFSTTLLLILGLKRFWYHGFFPNFSTSNFFIFISKKIEKILDVYIFKKIDIPIFC